MSLTTHADLAEADAIVLADEGRYDGPTPPLTGGEALDIADLAAIAAELSRRPVARKIQSDDDVRAKMAARGLPSGAVNMALGQYMASRNGEFASVDPTFKQMLGRQTIRMRALLAEKLGASERASRTTHFEKGSS